MSRPATRRGHRRVEVGEHVRHRALDVEAAPLGARERPRGADVGRRAEQADHDDDRALDLGRVDEPLPGLPRDDRRQHEQHRAVDLGREDLRAAEAERERPRAAGGPRAARRRAPGAIARGVGEHVRRVGEQRERAGEDARHDLDAHEAQDDRQRDAEPAPVGVGRHGVAVAVRMPVMGVRVGCHKRVTKSGRTLSSAAPPPAFSPGCGVSFAMPFLKNLDLVLLALALPLFLVAGLPLLGWLTAAVIWACGAGSGLVGPPRGRRGRARSRWRGSPRGR